MDPAPLAKLPGKAGIFLHYGAILVAVVVAREMEGSRVTLYAAVTVLLVGMAAVEVLRGRKTYSANDLKNMEVIREQMQDLGFLTFVRTHNFQNNYLESKLEPLRKFSHLDGDSFFFDDPELESNWQDLKETIEALAHIIYQWHTPPELNGVCGFTRELRDRSHLESGFIHDPHSSESLAREMNDLSVKVRDSYLVMRRRFRKNHSCIEVQAPKEHVAEK